MTAHVAGMQLCRTNKQFGFKAITELSRQKDPVIFERTYDTYSKQHESIDDLPFPWQAVTESIVTGFHKRFIPQGIRIRDETRHEADFHRMTILERIGIFDYSSQTGISTYFPTSSLKMCLLPHDRSSSSAYCRKIPS